MNACDEDSHNTNCIKITMVVVLHFKTNLQENYINTLIGALRHRFTRGVAEEFDSNNLLGLDNALWISENWVM